MVPADELEAFLDRHLEVFNRAVRTGDFAPLVDLFATDARMEFVGVPVEPYVGRVAIATAYADTPPSDTMTLLERSVRPDGTVVEAFSWSADAGARSGEMRLRVTDGRIERLTVDFSSRS